MKILAFSDLHRDIRAADAIAAASQMTDVVVGAGDFGTRGEGTAETLALLKQCRAPVVLVHGNHDDPEEMRACCEGWPGGHYLHGTAVTLAGVPFFGVGGEVPSRNGHPWNAAEAEAAAAEMLARCPAGAILVTHTPPLGTADLQRDGTHEGSTAIRDAVQTQQPLLHLCGHIHHAWGLTGRIGATPVHNLGPSLTWLEI